MHDEQDTKITRSQTLFIPLAQIDARNVFVTEFDTNNEYPE